MKKTVVLLLFAVFAVGTVSVSAQSESDTGSTPSRGRAPLRKNYINFSYYGIQNLFYDTGKLAGTSELGTGLTMGHSYILHRNPIAGMLHIGLDATWIDLNYAYSDIVVASGAKGHQVDIAIGVGPSIHLTPVSKLGIHTYFRYNPTFATYFESGQNNSGTTKYRDNRGGYASMFVCGAAASWGVISLGFEGRWGEGMYYNLDDDDDGVPKLTIRSAGVRGYVSLRF